MDHWDLRVAERCQEGDLELAQGPGRILGLLGVEVHSCNLQPGARTGDVQQEARTVGDLDLGDLDNAGLQVVLHRGRVQEGDHGGRQEEGPLH